MPVRQDERPSGFIGVAEFTIPAGADITAGQVLVRGTADNTAVPAAGATKPFLGVALNSVTSGDSVSIVSTGRAKVLVGAAILESELDSSGGVYLTSNTSGRAIASAATTDNVFGLTFESAAVNDSVTAILTHFRRN